jgi:phenylalanyl-tRNA synthetase beta chain
MAAKRKLKQEIYLAEIFADRLLQRRLREIRYTPLSKFPAVARDFSFIFSDEVTFGKMEAAVQGLGIAELRSFSPVEIFRGGSIEAGKYSVLLSARLQSMERTLREDEVADWAAKIVKALQGLGGVQRA